MKSITSGSSKNNRKVKVVIFVIVLLTILVCLSRIDRNPEITYNPTDGSTMVIELQSRLKSDEDLEMAYVPIDVAAGTKIPAPLYSATVVKYDRPKFPFVVRWLLRLVHLPVEGAHLSFDRGDFAMIDRSNLRTGILSTQREQRDFHQLASKNFPDQIFADGVIKEADGMAVLAPNSHLKLHSDFLMIETKGQVRVYLLDQLPANIAPIRDRVYKAISNAPSNPKR